MASCSYCGRTISPNANICPGCGEPDPAPSGFSWIAIFVVFGIAVVAAIAEFVITYQTEIILFLITCGVIGVGYALWKKKKSYIPNDKQITIPDLEPNFFDVTETITITQWLKEAGDHVEEGDIVLVIETDKVSMELHAPKRGVIDVIHYPGGSQVSVGDIIYELR